MSYYRLYLLDRAGHIGGFVDFDCDTDEEAIRLAGEQRHAHAMELWSQNRHIQTFPPPK